MSSDTFMTNGQQQPCDFTGGADYARAIAGAIDCNDDAAFVYTRVRDLLNERDEKIAALTPTASEATAIGAGEVPLYKLDEAWAELLEKDDRTSPEDYPDMCLITHDELRCYMEARQYAASPKVASDTDTAIPAGEECDRQEVEELLANWRASLANPASWLPRLRTVLSASPKPDTDTPVDPGVEGVERALSGLFKLEVFAEGDDLRRVQDAITVIHALAAKPIAGMDAGEVEDA